MRNIHILLSALAMTALAACSSGPPVPDWKMNAQSSVERFPAAALGGTALVEPTEFRRAARAGLENECAKLDRAL
ncbi:MAG: hypothetical protein RSF79_09895 [Janthinobacterium sp.]